MIERAVLLADGDRIEASAVEVSEASAPVVAAPPGTALSMREAASL